MDNWGFYQDHHNKSSLQNLWHYSNWASQRQWNFFWETWEYLNHQQFGDFWSNWPCWTLLQGNDRCPFVWRCAAHFFVGLSPLLPIGSVKHFQIGIRIGRQANIPLDTYSQLASTSLPSLWCPNSILYMPCKWVCNILNDKWRLNIISLVYVHFTHAYNWWDCMHILKNRKKDIYI